MSVEEQLLHRDSSEKAVLGAISVENSVLDDVVQLLKPHMFTFDTHRYIYEAMLSLRDDGTDINDSTIFQEIIKAGRSEKVPAFEVSHCLPYTSPSQATYFAASIANDYVKTQVKQTIERISAKAEMESTDGFELIENVISTLESITDSVGVSDGIETLATILDEVSEGLDSHEVGTLSGVPSGIKSVDDLTNGFQKGNLIIVAGRPAMGKSAFVTTIINNAASLGFPCALFSLEMSNREVGARLSAVHTRFAVQDINKKKLFNDQKAHFREKIKEFKNLPIYVGDSSDLTITNLKAQVRNLVRKKGVELVVVDYLQLMRGSGNTASREQEISEISRSLKNLAKELDIAIIALSQLSRAVENRESPRPQLSDLRESGSIEQDANMVMFLYRPEYYDQQKGIDTPLDERGLAQLIVGKNRDGETGNLDMEFHGAYSYFTDWEVKL